ncbi:MAG: hypothetical protein RIR70_1283 [Pseudomonadota bacterium]|jgi:hypothetical protein
MIVLRVFLLLLIFSNLVLFFWGQGVLGGQSAQGEPERLGNQLDPEKISIVSPDTQSAPAKPTSATQEPASTPAAAAAPTPTAAPAPAESAPAKSAKPANTETVCIALQGFGREQARVVVSKFKGDTGIKTVSRSLGDPDTFWVMYPEFASRALADKKAAELRGLGVTDLFIMGDDTPHPNSISLGLFKSREKADEHLESLKKKGVRQARIVVREAANARQVIEFTGPRDAVIARASLLQGNYRGIERGKCGAGD